MRCLHSICAVPVQDHEMLPITCLRVTGFYGELNKTAEATAPVKQYSNRTLSCWRRTPMRSQMSVGLMFCITKSNNVLIHISNSLSFIIIYCCISHTCTLDMLMYCKFRIFGEDFIFAKFRENKPLTKWQKSLSFINIGKSCLCHEIFTPLICLLMPFAK